MKMGLNGEGKDSVFGDFEAGDLADVGGFLEPVEMGGGDPFLGERE